jgi:hypothetical protein
MSGLSFGKGETMSLESKMLVFFLLLVLGFEFSLLRSLKKRKLSVLLSKLAMSSQELMTSVGCLGLDQMELKVNRVGGVVGGGGVVGFECYGGGVVEL